MSKFVISLCSVCVESCPRFVMIATLEIYFWFFLLWWCYSEFGSYWGSFYQHGLTFQAWIHYDVWEEMTNPFPNLNSTAVEVWEWISNFVPHFTEYMYMITYPCWDYSWIMLLKGWGDWVECWSWNILMHFLMSFKCLLHNVLCLLLFLCKWSCLFQKNSEEIRPQGIEFRNMDE